MNYELDLENSFINYITQTQRKYFKIALKHTIENNLSGVKINRITYIFDFKNNEVFIGTNCKDSNKDLQRYKLKRI